MAETTTRAPLLHATLMFEAAAAAVVRHAEAAAAAPVGERLPDSVRTWLARLRLLEGVPFQYLIPDAELLPPESIRFFYLDREWTDALVQGALSVSTVSTLDRADLQALYAGIRDEVDAEERRVRMVGGEQVGFGPAGAISGFLLRSRIVSGWPALHMRAYKDDVVPDTGPPPENDTRMRLLRLERLAPAVLLCLFDGVPAVVHIEEPRAGVQYGVDMVPGIPGTATHPPGAPVPRVRLRDVTNASFIGAMAAPTFQRGPGVIEIQTLADQMAAVPACRMVLFEGKGCQSAEFALEMLQFPYRQVFGDVAKPLAAADPFEPEVAR
jgi:hypothetical protein